MKSKSVRWNFKNTITSHNHYDHTAAYNLDPIPSCERVYLKAVFSKVNSPKNYNRIRMHNTETISPRRILEIVFNVVKIYRKTGDKTKDSGLQPLLAVRVEYEWGN